MLELGHFISRKKNGKTFLADDFLIALPLPHGQSMRTINKTNDLCHRILLNMHLSVLWQSILYIFFLLCSAVRFANEVYAPNEKNNPNRLMFFALSIFWSSFGLFVGFICSNIKINSQFCLRTIIFKAKSVQIKNKSIISKRVVQCNLKSHISCSIR